MATQDKTKRINVSKEEVEKFNELAHKWWDEESEFKPLHQINPLRLNFIHEKINLKNKKVLDVKINPEVKNIFEFKFEDFVLENYEPDPAIKAPVAV